MLNEINELKKLLAYANITQSDLAKQFKVTKMAVSKWLNGKSEPSKKKLKLIQAFIDKFKTVVKKRGIDSINRASKLDKDLVVSRLIEFWNDHRGFDANIRGLSKFTGASPRTVYNWLNRKTYPKPSKVRLIDEWLNKQ